MPLAKVPQLIEDIRAGRMVILMDDEDRENEGDLIMAAEHVTPDTINFMATHARGLICMPITQEHCERLRLASMTEVNRSRHRTNFTVSIEAATGISTGISAADRARTVQVAAAADAGPDDIVTPGHVFPLVAEPGGVLSRLGHTEAACDLARMAGCQPAAVLVEIMNEDGTMARRTDLEPFAVRHNLKLGTIADLVRYRALHDSTVEAMNNKQINTRYGTFNVTTWLDTLHGRVHLSLTMGEVRSDQPTLVRVHVPNVLLDLVGAVRDGPPSWSISHALQRVAEEGAGVVVLLAANESAPDVLQRFELFPDVPDHSGQPADATRIYHTIGLGSQILRSLGVSKMRLMSFPTRYNAISGFDLEIIEYIDAEGGVVQAADVHKGEQVPII